MLIYMPFNMPILYTYLYLRLQNYKKMQKNTDI